MAYLAHHGILGQKWGIRRYQNADGTLTDEGKQRYQEGRYSNSGSKRLESIQKDNEKLMKEYKKLTGVPWIRDADDRDLNDLVRLESGLNDPKKESRIRELESKIYENDEIIFEEKLARNRAEEGYKRAALAGETLASAKAKSVLGKAVVASALVGNAAGSIYLKESGKTGVAGMIGLIALGSVITEQTLGIASMKLNANKKDVQEYTKFKAYEESGHDINDSIETINQWYAEQKKK